MTTPSPPNINSKPSNNFRSKSFNPSRFLWAWSFVFIFTVTSLILIERAYVLNPINEEESESLSVLRTNLDPKILRSSFIVDDGSLLIDVREPIEIEKDGFHPSSILLPYSKLKAFIGKNYQHVAFLQLLVNFIDTIDKQRQSEEGLLVYVISIVQEFVSIALQGDLNSLNRQYWTPLYETVETILFTPEELMSGGAENLGFLSSSSLSFREIIDFIEYHPSKKIQYVNEKRLNGEYNFFGSFGSADSRIEKARQIYVICSGSGWRAKIAAHLLRTMFSSSQLIQKNPTSIVTLSETFVQLIPDENYRKWGFVRETFKPKKDEGNDDSASSFSSSIPGHSQILREERQRRAALLEAQREKENRRYGVKGGDNNRETSAERAKALKEKLSASSRKRSSASGKDGQNNNEHDSDSDIIKPKSSKELFEQKGIPMSKQELKRAKKEAGFSSGRERRERREKRFAEGKDTKRNPRRKNSPKAPIKEKTEAEDY